MDQHWGKNPGSPYHEESDRTCQECQRRAVCPDSENFHMAEICIKYQDIRNERLDLLAAWLMGAIKYSQSPETAVVLEKALDYIDVLKNK